MSLYRTWRPKTFADLVGQDAVVRTLTTAIDTGRLAPAERLVWTALAAPAAVEKAPPAESTTTERARRKTDRMSTAQRRRKTKCPQRSNMSPRSSSRPDRWFDAKFYGAFRSLPARYAHQVNT